MAVPLPTMTGTSQRRYSESLCAAYIAQIVAYAAFASVARQAVPHETEIGVGSRYEVVGVDISAVVYAAAWSSFLKLEAAA